ncbi:MAG: molybdenum cofactor guanylyltransferase [Solirubrobacteraceae bacterium]|nr:molybdenum cofactor guanylyltransferase [Solirubrobacteraceae bacterium]
MSAAALAVVLAGGRSARMGSPKAMAPLLGEPLIARPLAAARAAGLEVVVVAKAGSPVPEDAEVWLEPDTPAHPLTGLVAALERAGGRAVVALACDMPFVAPELLAALAALDAPAAAGRVDGRLEPFPGRYGAGVLGVLRSALAREAPLREALAALDPLEVDLAAFGEPARLVRSVNTPAELAAAERELA